MLQCTLLIDLPVTGLMLAWACPNNFKKCTVSDGKIRSISVPVSFFHKWFGYNQWWSVL